MLLRIILGILVFSFLTILTQIGGLVYLISLSSYKFINTRTSNKVFRTASKLLFFLMLYFFATFLIVPNVAKYFGRVGLPVVERNNLQPLNVLTCCLNRHYVCQELRQTAFEVAKEMNNRFPGTKINYLDANFPFIIGFPLFPHLSHNDGKKLDLSFCYLDSETTKPTNSCPSFIGYGICEEPLIHELQTFKYCERAGYWQYSLLSKLISQKNKLNYRLDNERTKALISLFAFKPTIGRIFLEPHLKIRFMLTSPKIRFHGCQAVRHDDHIHVQLN